MNKLIQIFLLMSIQGVLLWYHLNLPKVYGWWKVRPYLNIFLFGPPLVWIGYFYWQITVQYFGSLWSARFFSFAVNTIIFSIMTWHYCGESPLELKTFLCLMLSIAIISIQLFL